MKPFLLVAVLALLVGWLVAVRIGKSADARAYAISRMADERAADIRQAREQRQARFELDQAKNQAVAPYVVQGRIILVYVLVGVVGLLSMAVVGGIAYLSIGVARAGVVAANIQARRLPMNPETMHFDLYIYNNGHREYVCDANTGLVLPADEAHSIIKLLAENSGATRRLGVQPHDMILLNNKEQDNEHQHHDLWPGRRHP